jgi:transposase InsO family protein
MFAIKMKKKYDSSVVFLYATGNEHLLPYSFRKKIPYPTISTWRKTDYSQYTGHEFRKLFDPSLDSVAVRAENEDLRNALDAVARCWFSLSRTFIPLMKSAAAQDVAVKKNMLDAVRRMSRHVGHERAMRFMGLSKTEYYHWMLQARFDCFDSFTSLCVKRHPHQLQVKEIKRMKKMLTDPELDHWPIVSIAGMALREKNLVASIYSWYKYAKLWGVNKKLVKKDKKKIGLVATRPNEYLHVDTTFYPLIDGKEACISFVLDNYSKMILGFHVAERNTFEIVRNSMRKALAVVATHPDQKLHAHSFMVTDGGAENRNRKINEFIAQLTDHKLTRVIALKDIRFSNSPVEAVHRTLKGRYLKNRKFESLEAVEKYLDWAVHDYNRARPHYKHRPRTPYEVYFGIPLNFNVRQRVRKAVLDRVRENKCTQCIQCKSLSCKSAPRP